MRILKDKANWHTNSIPDPETGCWNWLHGLNADGYGWLRGADGKNTRAHCFTYKMFVGEAPVGMVVRHTCHNRKCCNPDHLLLGTQQDNMRDMVEAGRSKSVKRFFPRNHGAAVSAGLKKALAELKAKGIRRRNQSKLSLDDVREIRRLATGGMSRKDLAARYSMSLSGMHNIVSGKVFTDA